ncbi:hypothetical protein [Rhizobium sp. MHM7A]|uniref:hypothetical protein n=1 Tax=Rhizobium sp. MHM7A TaxID=2583233 RepID=UPI0011063F84|nr:hypothetical protein [Rhizobium sp. MHM7A]TLX16107.1 hypothetical protein FFR93_01940 [Rhizobium sp. MHM7A]
MTLTLEKKLEYAAGDARLKEAEKHFFDKAQPFFPKGFSVYYRGDGCHWDISAEQTPGRISAFHAAYPEGHTTGHDGGSERAFKVRGKPGAITIHDERWDPYRPHPREVVTVKSVSMAMAWIVEELMQLPDSERDG